MNNTRTSLYTEILERMLCNNNNVCEPALGESVTSCPGDCRPLVCIVGEMRCVDNNLQMCGSGGYEWVTNQTCEYGCNSTILDCNPESLFLYDLITYFWYMIIALIGFIAYVIYRVSRRNQID